MARLDKWESKHLKDVERYARQIEAIYQSAVREAAAIGATIPNFNPNKPFSFANYPSTKARIEKLLQTLKTGISTVILNGIEAEWTLANNKNNELCNVVFGEYATKLSPEQARKYYNTNDKACKAFTERKIGGLKLSDRVWRYTEQFKTEIEMGIDLGLRNMMKLESKTIEIRWAQDVKQADGSTKTEGCKAFLRCVSKGIPGLNVDPGNASENEIALAVSRYQLFVAGNEYWLIDQLNTIMRVGGVDYAKDIRSVL